MLRRGTVAPAEVKIKRAAGKFRQSSPA